VHNHVMKLRHILDADRTNNTTVARDMWVKIDLYYPGSGPNGERGPECYFIKGFHYVEGSAFATSVVADIPTFLIDLRAGTVERFHPFANENGEQSPTALRSLRASLVTAEAFRMRIAHDRRLASKVPRYVIALDIEHAFGNPNIVYEVGAIVYDMHLFSVVDVYHKLSGCRPITEKPDMSSSANSIMSRPFTELTGLVPDDTVPDWQGFYEWLEPHRVLEGVSLLSWGGSDSKFVNKQGAIPNINVMSWYADHVSGRIKASRKLEKAVEAVFGPMYPWTPHRAFDDALMTLGVFIAITQPR
jgi:hypothetical protein